MRPVSSFADCRPTLHPESLPRGFTIVEVMMASVILVVGFIGMISAITIGSEMLATANRSTIATQIIAHETEKLRLKDWSYISGLGNASAATYDSTASGSTAIDTAIAGSGVTFSLSRTVTTITTDLREVTFTVTWTRGGTTTAANTPTGSWLNRLAFQRPSTVSRTYTRIGSAYFGKYGLNLNLQRS